MVSKKAPSHYEPENIEVERLQDGSISLVFFGENEPVKAVISASLARSFRSALEAVISARRKKVNATSKTPPIFRVAETPGNSFNP